MSKGNVRTLLKAALLAVTATGNPAAAIEGRAAVQSKDTQRVEPVDAEAFLAADDECLVDGESGSRQLCALNALQRRGLRATAVRVEAPAAEKDARANQSAVDVQPAKANETQAPLPPPEYAEPSLQAGWQPPWMGSCAVYNCPSWYVRGHACQCNPGCVEHGSCCADYFSRCRHSAPPPVPHPPVPQPGGCAASWSHDCRQTKKCCDPTKTCYEKNSGWAACLPSCQPGIHYVEPRKHWTPWSCRVLSGGSAPAPPTTAPPPTCARSYSDNCIHVKRCCDPSKTCFAKNPGWASCLPACTPGIHYNEPRKYWTPWSCQVIGPPPTHAPTTTPPPAVPTTLPDGWTTTSTPAGYYTNNPALQQNSTAPLHTFYVYRTQNDEDYEPENQNLADLPGALWYLHNEIVWHVPRRFGKTRVQRFKVQTRATQPLFDKGMNFGVRMAFDSGRCTGPYWPGGEDTCNKDWSLYGFNVGCNYVGEFPNTQWKEEDHYPNGIWYSFPGECTNSNFWSHTDACRRTMPGGHCPPGVSPTGSGTCTYSFELAGEIRIDELDGIEDYDAFTKNGGQEYNWILDTGVHNDFWAKKLDTAACEQRIKAAEDLFKQKYPDEPTDEELPPPPCDFNYGKYYSS